MTQLLNATHDAGALPCEHGSETDIGENLSRSDTAALGGTTYGLACVATSTIAYVWTLGYANTSGTVRARLYFDPNGITMADNDTLPLFWLRNTTPDVFAGTSILKFGADYYIQIWAIDDTPVYRYLTAIQITDAPHYIELLVTKSTGNNGTLYGWVDGVAPSPVASYTNLDNDTRFAQFNSYRFGVPAPAYAGTSGTFYVDELVINDDGSAIGPLAVPSDSVSPSVSPSASLSPSSSNSPSLSPSASTSPSSSNSPSLSPSASASPSTEYTVGEVTWGHVTGVLETNIRTFTGNWTGTGSIDGTGDAEKVALNSGEYLESEVVNTGGVLIELLQNNYQAADTVTLKYRTGTTVENCSSAGWIVYSTTFTSSGYVQLRIEATI